MGLFFTALERANPDDNPAGRAEPASPPAAAAAPGAPVMDWQQASQFDLAGYPLDAAVVPPAAEAAEPAAAAPIARRWAQLDTAALGVDAIQAGPGKEQYRILRTRVLEAMRTRNLRSLLITSAGSGEGKTVVSVNLALGFSSLREGRVLLVDADLRRAGLSRALTPAPGAGLAQYLKGEAALEPLLCDVDPWLTVLPGQPAQEDAAELLASQRFADLLQEARRSFDLVLVDAAPVGPVADSRGLAGMLDASLLVVRADMVPFEGVEQAAALLRPRLLGAVLNGARHLPKSKYGYPYTATPAAARPEAAATSAEAQS